MKMKIKNGRLSPYTKNSIISYGIVIIAFVVVSVLNGMGLVSSTLQGLNNMKEPGKISVFLWRIRTEAFATAKIPITICPIFC